MRHWPNNINNNNNDNTDNNAIDDIDDNSAIEVLTIFVHLFFL